MAQLYISGATAAVFYFNPFRGVLWTLIDDAFDNVINNSTGLIPVQLTHCGLNWNMLRDYPFEITALTFKKI